MWFIWISAVVLWLVFAFCFLVVGTGFALHCFAQFERHQRMINNKTGRDPSVPLKQKWWENSGLNPKTHPPATDRDGD